MVSAFLSLILIIISIVALLGRLTRLRGCELALEWEAGVNRSASIIFLIVLDWISIFFLSVVALISARVLYYSRSYISSDAFYSRFILLVLRFIFRMWILILRPNFIRILLGWDGLGVTSYLLVIYYQREKSYNAGIITALTNRLGDAGLLIFIGLITQIGRWSFLYYSRIAGVFRSSFLILLVAVAITKRAQIPFSAWLPAAMAAPTPVSSLVHSSTLVTAGVYLLIRINYLISRVEFLWGLTLLGAITIFIAGRAAIAEVDIKKIIALSTLSQLGLIFMTLGIGLPALAFFHLVAHAYFKAILFICAGGVIHRIKEFQDLRTIGGAVVNLPLALRIFLVANLSLCGFPFITGFFSKDLILELLMIRNVSIVIFILAIVATGLTITYSIRIFRLIFLGASLSEACFFLRESDKIIMGGILVLLIPSIFGGILVSWICLAHNYLIYLPAWLKQLIIAIILISSILAAWKLPRFKKSTGSEFIQFMWFIPMIFSRAATRVRLRGRKVLLSRVDRGWNILLILRVFKKINFMWANYIGLRFKGRFIKRIFFFLVLIIFM